MPDLETRADIDELVHRFYKQALTDAHIGFFFTDVVQVDLEAHLPRIGDFWESIIFGQAVYKGNPMLKHLELHAKHPLEAVHFERWLSLWERTVRALFEGEHADMAMHRAQRIGALMQHKIKGQGGLNL